MCVEEEGERPELTMGISEVSRVEGTTVLKGITKGAFQ